MDPADAQISSKPAAPPPTPKLMTVCFLLDGKRVLLGMKKRGFGAGRWNGFGGKLQPAETIESAARREFREEAGIEVKDLHPRGAITFHAPNRPAFKVHIFIARGFSGEPRESEEMKPQWFAIDAIPVSQMWPTDVFWIEKVLAGASVNGEMTFDESDNAVSKAVVFSPI